MAQTDRQKPPQLDWRQLPELQAGSSGAERRGPALHAPANARQMEASRRAGSTATPVAERRIMPSSPHRTSASVGGSGTIPHAPEAFSVPPAGANARPLTEFERARRHAGRVRVLKWALPAGGVLVLVLILASLVFSGSYISSVDLGQLRLEQGQLVMDRPELKGVDNQSRPYRLTATRAIQDAEQPTRIRLEGISASLPLSDDAFARIEAGNGLYDADAKTLELDGTIAVDTDEGMYIRMNDARIDIESGHMHTSSPVEVESGRTILSADSMTVEDNGERIIFSERVRMTILPAAQNMNSSAPNSGQPEAQ